MIFSWTYEQALAKQARFTPAMTARYNRVVNARKELIAEGEEPSALNIKERAGFSSTGTVYTYLAIVEALLGLQPEPARAAPEQADEPFSDAIVKLTTEAKAHIDGLGEKFTTTIKAAVEEVQRRSQMTLQTHIEVSDAALREAKAETDSVRDKASVMADEVEQLELRALELDDQLKTATDEGNCLKAELQEKCSSFNARSLEVENAQCRIGDLERLEGVLRLDLNTERTERHEIQSELKSESSRRQDAEKKLAGLEEQLDARLRETLQLRGDITTLHRKIASLEERLYGATVS